MKGAERIKDDRLHPRPRVYRDADGVITMKFRVMTPFRLLMFQFFFLYPLISLWRVVTFLFVTDCVLFHFELFTVFRYLPFTRNAAGIALAIPFILWLIERVGSNLISRFLFGKTIQVRVTHDDVEVRTGWFSRESFPRSRRIGFATFPFRDPRTSTYRNSELFCVITDDIRREPLSEVYNRKFLSHIVTNANVALLLTAQQSETEMDPVKQRLSRLRG
jgi:hypothetical protein